MSRPLRLPIVTLLLIAANILAAFVVAVQPDLVEQFGFSAQAPSVLTVGTSLFLHQNVVHLLGNMVFLAAVGASVELATGSLRFMLVYFISGFLGVGLHWLVMSRLTSAPVLIGASGAISGCAGYYAARYPSLRVPLGPRISASILVITLGWVAMQALGAVIKLGDPEPSISYWAHLGGFVGGILLSLLFRAPDIGQERIDQAVRDDASQRGPAATALAARRHLLRHPRDGATLTQLADALEVLGEKGECVSVLCRLMDVAPEAEQPSVISHINRLDGLDRIPSARALSLAAAWLPTQPGVAVMLWQSLANRGESPERPTALFLLGEHTFEKDRNGARKIFAELQAYPEDPFLTKAKARGYLK